MNSLSLLPLLIALISSAFTPLDAVAVDAVGQWLSDRAMQAAQRDTGPPDTCTPGSYTLMHLNNLDAPDAVKQQLREQIERDRAPLVRVSNGTIPSRGTLLMRLPRKQRSDAVLRSRLPNPPSALHSTSLATAKLIGMEPTGALDGVKSSGLSRYYDLRDVGIVSFNEENFRACGARIEAFLEAQNTHVNGVPAQIYRSADSQGRGEVTLSWASSEKLYSLSAVGNDDVDGKERALHAIAAGIRD
jgi:hypothetical protein